MDTPNFLLDAKAEPPDDSELSRLELLIENFRLYEDKIEALELELKSHKEAKRQIGQVAIPELLNKHGLSEIRLKSGMKVIIKEDASITVPPENRESFYSFLKARKEEDIIKLQLQFKRMPQEQMTQLFEFLDGYEYEYDADNNVHPQTLKKYFKNLLGIGEEDREQGIKDGRYLTPEKVQGFANIFTFFDTKLK
jgi:hypothetical protein